TDLAAPDFYRLALHDALPISPRAARGSAVRGGTRVRRLLRLLAVRERLEPRALLAEEELHDPGRSVALLADDQLRPALEPLLLRSEEHTSELQSREKLVCRLL